MQIYMFLRRSWQQPLLVIAALVLLPQVCTALKTDSDVDVATSQEKKPLSRKQCLKVVKKVEKTGKYTEESIVPLCNEELKSGGCAFFAEALSLASSHSDFKAVTFCSNMDRAQFCSEIMDKLLESTAVSDMAFGACERAKPRRSLEYCRKIQQMLTLSVKQEDLDTMRACYMMEAYANQTAKAQASDASTKNRIIASSNKELENAGEGSGPGHPPKIATQASPLDAGGKGKPTPPHPKAKGIIAEPVPLDNFGRGKGNTTRTTPGSIIVEPQPLDPVGKGKNKMSEPTPKPKTIITEPVPLERFGKGKTTETPTAKPKNILTEPIPAEQNTIPTRGPTVAPASGSKGTIATVPLPNLPSVHSEPAALPMTLPVALPVEQRSTVNAKPALQQPSQTVYVISMPPVASNTSVVATATQRQEIVAELLAATQSAVKVPTSQSPMKAPAAEPKLTAKLALTATVPTVALAATNTTNGTNTVTTMRTKPKAKQMLTKASNATVSNHTGKPGKHAKHDKTTLVGKFLRLFHGKAAVTPKKDSKKNKKIDYGGFLSGFVS